MNQEDCSKVAVIIVNYNGAPYLQRCLSAVYSQTVRPKEVIVLDNASTDESIEIIKNHESVRLIAQTENLGFARGNNLAVKAVSADVEWIALLNPDAFPDYCWLEELLAATRMNPDHKVFASKLIDANNPLVLDGKGDVYHISGRVWRDGHGETDDTLSTDVREIFSLCAAAALYRRDVYEQIGGFDEDFFCYMEDVDLGFRLRLLGHNSFYVPKAVAHHVGSAITGKHSAFSIYHGHRNLVWTYFKNMPGVFFWLFLPLHILLNFFAIIWFSLHGKFSVILRSKVDAFRGIPRMWKKRCTIQKKRKASLSDIWRALDKSILPCFTRMPKKFS